LKAFGRDSAQCAFALDGLQLGFLAFDYAIMGWAIGLAIYPMYKGHALHSSNK
jgi:hypothetical protein